MKSNALQVVVTFTSVDAKLQQYTSVKNSFKFEFLFSSRYFLKWAVAIFCSNLQNQLVPQLIADYATCSQLLPVSRVVSFLVRKFGTPEVN